MVKLIWTEPALYDLNEIAEYIALDNLIAAKGLVKKVFEAAEKLTQFPEAGRKPPELELTAYREIMVGPCRIFYRREKLILYIIYVMRGERLLIKYILDERSSQSKS